MHDREFLDLTSVYEKLNAAGILKKKPGGFYGLFDTKKHGPLLTEDELRLFHAALHAGKENEECTGLHEFNFDEFND